MNDGVQEMWAAFVAAGAAHADASYTSWHFGTGGAMADELVELVLEGRKRATAGIVWDYEHEGEPLPRPGDHSIVTDGSGVARCIIRTTSVEIVPFDKVPADFAAAEGEGDLSLDYWRVVHWRAFTGYLHEIGLEPTHEMPVVCERFEVVWPLG